LGLKRPARKFVAPKICCYESDFGSHLPDPEIKKLEKKQDGRPEVSRRVHATFPIQDPPEGISSGLLSYTGIEGTASDRTQDSWILGPIKKRGLK
jgi:hypothetical protein